MFNSKIRKMFKHEPAEGEKFVTEARMYHKMDLKYKIVGINTPLMICEYRKDGYTKNIKEIFKANPKGYYAYFKEILQMPLKNVTFNKRLYAVKHYLLFCYELKKKPEIKQIKNVLNKVLTLILYLPGKIKYYIWQ